jgi:hypothetical protein
MSVVILASLTALFAAVALSYVDLVKNKIADLRSHGSGRPSEYTQDDATK